MQTYTRTRTHIVYLEVVGHPKEEEGLPREGVAHHMRQGEGACQDNK
jgi:hypothetical protein